jgi:radical SAM-linked protein
MGAIVAERYHPGTMSTDGETPRQRWQIVYSRTHPALRLRQQDIMAEFQRVLTEAELPLSHTAARRPRPRIRLAAVTPANLEIRGDIIEVWFDQLVERDRLLAAGESLAEGLAIVDAREVWHGFPSAASQVRGAEYEVGARAPEGTDEEALRAAVVELLAAPALPGMRRRGESERRADTTERDLRPYIEDLEVLGYDPESRTVRFRMQLRLDPSGAGRPRDVVDALGLRLEMTRAVRERLVFVDTPAVAR